MLRFNGGFLRAISTFALPFSFGFFLMMVIVICLPVALADLSRRRNRWFVVLCPLLVVGLVTSIVRTAMIGLVVGLLYIGFRRFKVGVRRAGARSASSALFLIPGSSASKALSSDSTKARSANWSENFDAILDHPLGIGVGETGAAKARSYGQTVEEQAAAFGIDRQQPDTDVYTPILGGNGVYQPDNYYVKTVVELGLLGLWLLLRILYGASGRSRRLERALDPVDARLRYRHDGLFRRRRFRHVLLDVSRVVPDGHVLLAAPRHDRRHRPRADGGEPVRRRRRRARRSCGCSTVNRARPRAAMPSGTTPLPSPV